MSIIPCSCCKQTKYSGQFWNLNGYYGLSGRFCSDCYDKISHDSYGKPKHPEQYTMILLRMGK
jgi:hypothetical protein